MTYRTAALLATALLAACSGGGASTPSPAAPVATSAAPSAAPPTLGAAIDALAAPVVAAGLTPSLVIGVARAGRPPLIRAYGQRSLASAEPADAATAYQIGSLTKGFTAAAIVLLAQSGALTLDDTFGRWVPEYARGAAITLRQALSMTSGIPADVNAGFTTLYGPLDPAGFVARLNAVPLDFSPGTAYAYSNQGYYLLGLVVERASGQPWASYVAQHFLAPLNLVRTTFVDGALAADTATGAWHQNVPGGALQTRPSWSYGYLYAFGSLVSTAGDVLAWDEALRTRATALDAASTATLFAVPFPAVSPRYALGWFADPDGTRYHDGETSGFHTAHAIYGDGYDIVVLGNDWDTSPGAYDPLALVQSVHALVTTTPL